MRLTDPRALPCHVATFCHVFFILFYILVCIALYCFMLARCWSASLLCSYTFSSFSGNQQDADRSTASQPQINKKLVPIKEASSSSKRASGGSALDVITFVNGASKIVKPGNHVKYETIISDSVFFILYVRHTSSSLCRVEETDITTPASSAKSSHPSSVLFNRLKALTYYTDTYLLLHVSHTSQCFSMW